MYLAGNVFSYFMTPKVMMLFPILFVIFFFRFPETPIFLIRRGDIQEAENALKFLRGYTTRDELSDDLRYEIEKMIRKVNDDAIKKYDLKINGCRELDKISD